ncbi:AAEL008262-PA, partial [Aedes aegypti]
MMMEEANFMLTEIPGAFISHRPHAIHRFVPYPLHQPHLQPAPIYIHPQPRVISRPKTPPTPPAPEGTHIGHLYPEILAIIFEKLSVKDRGRAAQTCTVWRDVAYSKSCWRGVEASLHLRRPSPSLFTSLVKRGIKKVQILGCYNITDISLGYVFSTDLLNLRTLDLSLCKQVTDSSLGRIAQHLKNVEILELGGCSNITNTAGLSKETADGTPALEYLGLQDCQRLSDEALRHIAQGLTSLKSINLSFCVSVTDSGLKHLAKMTKLEELNLRACDNISDIGMAYLTEGGSAIISLDVSFCDKIADQALTHISQGLFHLKSLSLSACQITDEGLAKIAKSLHDLETLNIGQCARVTDKGLEYLADELNNLRAIDLYGCTRLT